MSRRTLILIVLALAAGRAGAAESVLSQLDREMKQVVAAAAPAVVAISAQWVAFWRSETGVHASDVALVRGRGLGQGTGFLVSPDGEVVTTQDVVRGATVVTVTFADGRTLQGKVVGTDAQTNLALVKVEGKDLPSLHLGDSDEAKPGGLAITIAGAPGLPGSVALGVIAGTDRWVGTEPWEGAGGRSQSLLQITGSIAPGASGGPVLDTRGEVIGVVTAGMAPWQPWRYTQPRRYTAPRSTAPGRGRRGVAVPPAQAQPAQPRGRASGAGRGQIAAAASARQRIAGAASARRRVAAETTATLRWRVAAAQAAFAGARAGLLELQGQVPGAPMGGVFVGSAASLAPAAGFAIPCNVVRRVLEDLRHVGRVRRGYLGIQLQTVDAHKAAELKLPHNTGVLVLEVIAGGPAAKAGLRRDDVLLELGGRALATPGDLLDAMLNHRPGEKVTLTYWRDGKRAYATVTLGEPPVPDRA